MRPDYASNDAPLATNSTLNFNAPFFFFLNIVILSNLMFNFPSEPPFYYLVIYYIYLIFLLMTHLRVFYLQLNK